MTEPASPPPPFYPHAAPWQSPPPPRTHAELTWQDIMALFFGVLTPLSIVALCFGHYSWSEAKKVGLKPHAVGMVGFIFGAIGSAAWTLFWIVVMIGRTANAVGH